MAYCNCYYAILVTHTHIHLTHFRLIDDVISILSINISLRVHRIFVCRGSATPINMFQVYHIRILAYNSNEMYSLLVWNCVEFTEDIMDYIYKSLNINIWILCQNGKMKANISCESNLIWKKKNWRKTTKENNCNSSRNYVSAVDNPNGNKQKTTVQRNKTAKIQTEKKVHDCQFEIGVQRKRKRDDSSVP